MSMKLTGLESQLNELMREAADNLEKAHPNLKQSTQQFIKELNNIKLRAQMFARGLTTKEIIIEMAKVVGPVNKYG